MKKKQNRRFALYVLIILTAVIAVNCKKRQVTEQTGLGRGSISVDTTAKANIHNSKSNSTQAYKDKKDDEESAAANDKNQIVDPENQPVRKFEPHSGFVLVRDYIPDVIEDIRYFTTNNFMGEKVNGYQANAAILTRQAAHRLKEAADEFRSMGYVIKIYDAYRPQSAVNHFVKWAQGADQKNKKDYYPTIAKNNLFPRYIARKSGHSKGSTVDMTICDKETKEEVDMGSHFDYFGPPSHTAFTGNYPGGTVNNTHNKNRMMLKRVMERHGFTNYANEWWHYTLNHQPYPNSYFNFQVVDK